MDRIATYYNRNNENQRLFSGRGELEFLRTKQIIEQFLPDETGLSIADVGGGSGPYAFWLAEKGHKVALFDLMPNHVEEAVSINEKAPNPLTRIETADVRSLELESQQYDVVLHPDEIEREAEEAHLQIVDHVAVEGVGWLWQNFDQIWSDPRQRTIMLEMIERTDRDRSLLGASGHILLVVKRRDSE